ncbi:MAG: hypothetical protein ACOY3I_07700 [Verrucomicrobiota bacterium]
MNFCDPEMRVDCADRLARIEQMLKDRIEQAQNDRQRIEDILFHHEDRISVLEKWRHWVLGVAGICGAITVALWEWVKGHLQFHV